MLNTMADMTALALVVIAGCVANRAELLNNKQAMALHTAVDRAQFQTSCSVRPDKSSPAKCFSRPSRSNGLNRIQRTEFTVGMTGCGEYSIFGAIAPRLATAASQRDPATSLGAQ